MATEHRRSTERDDDDDDDRAIDPDDFVRTITNPFLPFTPGTRYVYEDAEGGVDTVIVTNQTIKILGVTCTVVSDIARDEDGNVVERTKDYYAQDELGNVWYFGEDTAEILNGKVVSTEGTWRAGKAPEPGADIAQPGIIMLANPQKGNSYFEEGAPPVALDFAEVVSLNAKAEVPFGDFTNCLKTKNTTPLDPDILETKFYAKGIGPVLTIDVAGGGLREELVSFEGGLSNLVQAMASFTSPQSGSAAAFTTNRRDDNSSSQQMLAAAGHDGGHHD